MCNLLKLQITIYRTYPLSMSLNWCYGVFKLYIFVIMVPSAHAQSSCYAFLTVGTGSASTTNPIYAEKQFS